MEPDKIDLIKKIIETDMEVDRDIKRIEQALGISLAYSHIYETVSTAFDLAIDATSMAVGDNMCWIHWYIASGYGKKPIVAKGREIITVDDLIWLIDECGKSQPE